MLWGLVARQGAGRLKGTIPRFRAEGDGNSKFHHHELANFAFLLRVFWVGSHLRPTIVDRHVDQPGNFLESESDLCLPKVSCD